MNIELAIAIETFIQAPKASRMLELNRSRSVKAQRKLRDMLAHFDDFRPQLITPISVTAEKTARSLMNGQHLNDHWSVVSEWSAIDGQTLSLSQLEHEVFYRGFGTLAINDPEHLVLYVGEEPKSIRVLSNPAGSSSSERRRFAP